MTEAAPPVEGEPVKLIPKPPPVEGPPARPLVIASTLEWCARMWLMDHEPTTSEEFLAEAAAAFDRMVEEARAGGAAPE